eukprot:5174237-Pleurochrysis_carterae.AAC.3
MPWSTAAANASPRAAVHAVVRASSLMRAMGSSCAGAWAMRALERCAKRLCATCTLGFKRKQSTASVRAGASRAAPYSVQSKRRLCDSSHNASVAVAGPGHGTIHVQNVLHPSTMASVTKATLRRSETSGHPPRPGRARGRGAGSSSSSARAARRRGWSRRGEVGGGDGAFKSESSRPVGSIG